MEINMTNKSFLISKNPPPKDRRILMNCGWKYDHQELAWMECFWYEEGGFYEALHSNEARTEYATHWAEIPEIELS
jgi:hypothetical protein